MSEQAENEKSDASDVKKGADAKKGKDVKQGADANKGKDGKDTKKGKDGKKGKEGKKKGASGGASIATHPRAGAQVRRAKGWGGLGGFAIAGLLSYQAGVPAFDVGVRALVAGVVGYMLAWACSVTIWRYLVLAELRTLVEDGHLTPVASGQQAPGDQAADEDGT
jgi:hypothetical protein